MGVYPFGVFLQSNTLKTISNFVYRNSINTLPEIEVQVPIYNLRNNTFGEFSKRLLTKMSGEDYITDFYFKIFNGATEWNYNLNYGFTLKEKRIDSVYRYLMYDELNKVICNKTKTLCRTTLNEVLSYYYYNLNRPFNFPGFSNNAYNITFGKIDVDNLSLIDFLNNLNEYGIYWYIDSNGVINLERYTNLTSVGTITLLTSVGNFDIDITKERIDFSGVKIIKEPLESPIKTTEERKIITFANDYHKEATFNLPVKVRPSFNLYSITVRQIAGGSGLRWAAGWGYYNSEDNKFYYEGLLEYPDWCACSTLNCNIRRLYFLENNIMIEYACRDDGCQAWTLDCNSYPCNTIHVVSCGYITMVENHFKSSNNYAYYNCSETGNCNVYNAFDNIDDCYDTIVVSISTYYANAQFEVILTFNPNNLNSNILPGPICEVNNEDIPCILY
ncbi:MAG: hypothetical protein ACPL1F_00965, partial [bacterium]